MADWAVPDSPNVDDPKHGYERIAGPREGSIEVADVASTTVATVDLSAYVGRWVQLEIHPATAGDTPTVGWFLRASGSTDDPDLSARSGDTRCSRYVVGTSAPRPFYVTSDETELALIGGASAAVVVVEDVTV